MRLVVREGLEYAYTVRGESGPAALLLHGFTGCGASWLRVAQELRPGWRLILPDLLGHGASSAPGEAEAYRMEMAAAHLVALVDQAVGEPVHLVGYSMGGRLALYLALAYPQCVRSLFLESASPGLESAAERLSRRQADEALAGRILEKGVVAFVDEWERLPLFASQAGLPADVRAGLRRQRQDNRALGLAGSLRGMGTGAQPSLWERLAELRCPVRLVVGEWDAKFLALNRRMASWIPGAELVIVTQAGHATHLEQPERFTGLLQEFWARLPADTAPPHP